jgi:gliding motility-associated-like protein
MKMNDKLENAFKQALDNHELPYDASAWKAVQKQLPASKAPWYWIGGAAAVVLLVVLTITLTDNKNEVQSVVSESVLETETKSVTESEIKNSDAALNSKTPVSLDIKKNERLVVSNNSAANNASVNTDATTTNKTDGAATKTVTTSNSDASTAIQTNNNLLSPWNDHVGKASISGIQPYYCQNARVVLHADDVPAQTDVLWYLSDGRMLKGHKAEFYALKDLKVRMKLVHANDKSLTRITEWSSINVIEADIPEVVVQKTEKNTKNFVILTNANSNIENLVWRFGNSVCQAPSCSTYTTTKGAHNYTLESYDRNGCYASVSGTVHVNEDYNLYVENTFTPNGDGINDVFIPEALKLRAVNFKMTIYDRNGKLLYETTEISRPWDGSTNGQTLEDGAYVWVVTLINEEGQPEQYKGVVNLRR